MVSGPVTKLQARSRITSAFMDSISALEQRADGISGPCTPSCLAEAPMKTSRHPLACGSMRNATTALVLNGPTRPPRLRCRAHSSKNRTKYIQGIARRTLCTGLAVDTFAHESQQTLSQIGLVKTRISYLEPDTALSMAGQQS